ENRAGPGNRIGIDAAGMAHLRKGRLDFLVEIALQIRQAIGVLAFRRDGDAPPEDFQERPVVEDLHGPLNGRVARHELLRAECRPAGRYKLDGAWWRRRRRRVQHLGLLSLLAWGLTGLPAAAQSYGHWARAAGPSAHQAESIGKYNAGCLAGGVALPTVGPGFQLTEVSRNRRFAHPDLAAYLVELGLSVEQAGLGWLTIEDVAQPDRKS